MKRFVFRHDTVLKVRQARLESVEGEFAAARERALSKEREIGGLERERRGVKEHLREIRLDERTRLTVNSLRAYLQRLWIAQGNAQEDLAKLGEELHAKRAELVEARRQVKAIERLREHRLVEWQHAVDRDEQKALDDLRLESASAEILRMDGERKANAG